MILTRGHASVYCAGKSATKLRPWRDLPAERSPPGEQILDKSGIVGDYFCCTKIRRRPIGHPEGRRSHGGLWTRLSGVGDAVLPIASGLALRSETESRAKPLKTRARENGETKTNFSR